ncbi:MAG TPA: plasmid pRiA4b ORF-3 family protein [Pirellulales bacterium]|jgi:hypothetical protein|nr:plasmid pRiA4b ORF-3 family protein [Pirellulales bacterium]
MPRRKIARSGNPPLSVVGEEAPARRPPRAKVNALAAPPAKPRRTTKAQSIAKPESSRVYQFKITLLNSQPPIWRRIQMLDGTLDALHWQIQFAMGWTNSHLDEFLIRGKRYGEPEFSEDDPTVINSLTTRLSDLRLIAGQQTKFIYTYDFGDSWEHEIQVEASPPLDPKAKYPRCLEGERACPPEDCGGVWGYRDLLTAYQDRRHPDHAMYREWLGNQFNSEKFDPQKATKLMQRGQSN